MLLNISCTCYPCKYTQGIYKSISLLFKILVCSGGFILKNYFYFLIYAFVCACLCECMPCVFEYPQRLRVLYPLELELQMTLRCIGARNWDSPGRGECILKCRVISLVLLQVLQRMFDLQLPFSSLWLVFSCLTVFFRDLEFKVRLKTSFMQQPSSGRVLEMLAVKKQIRSLRF